MIYFIGLLGALFVAFVGFVVGIACGNIGASRGPSVLRVINVTGVVLCVVACVLLGVAINEVPLMVGAAIISGASAGITAHHFGRRLTPGIDYQVSIPEAVRDFGLRNFDRLDADSDGLIIFDNLSERSAKPADDQERELLKHMRDNLSLIGHSIGARRSTATGELKDEHNVVKARRTFDVVSNVYGVSREDLQSYPRRAKKAAKQPAKDAPKPPGKPPFGPSRVA